MRLFENETSVLPLPATRDLRRDRVKAHWLKRWLFRLLRRPIWQ